MRHHNYTLYLAFSLSHVQVLEVLSDWSYGVHSLRLHTVASRHIDISNCATLRDLWMLQCPITDLALYPMPC